MAQRGTLFLDEVGEMAPKTQVDLLRVLEQQEVRRLGGSELIPLDVRLLAATHRDVQELLAEGKLRDDFYYSITTALGPIDNAERSEVAYDLHLTNLFTMSTLKYECFHAWRDGISFPKSAMETISNSGLGTIVGRMS
jgi:transcriptional regulator of aromatic amino acid metabolism